MQLLARVVFPRSIDRGTGQPIASWLRGDIYTDVGEWQKLTIRDAGQLVAREAIALRTQGRRDIDEREAYVDLIVINTYTGAGTVEIWLDDLEIQGYVNLDEENGPQIARRPADPNDPRGSDPSAAPAGCRARLAAVGARPAADAADRATSGRAAGVAQVARLQRGQAECVPVGDRFEGGPAAGTVAHRAAAVCE